HIDAEFLSDLVEEDVARLRQRLDDVHPPMPAVAPTAEIALAQPMRTATVDAGERVDDAFLKGGGGDNELECRSGRVLAAKRPLRHRLARVLHQTGPVRLANAAIEEIGVEGRET